MNSPQANKIHNLNEASVLDSSSVQQPFAGFSKLKRLWINVVNAANVQARLEQFASASETTQPQVSQKIDRNGQDIWKVYNPVTGRSHAFNTEEDIRVWYEQRHRERPAATNLYSRVASVQRHWHY